MTKEEAMGLKAGDKVIGRLIGEVVSVEGIGGYAHGFVHIAAKGEKNSRGGPRRGRFDYIDVYKVDPLSANVYADWLEDQGHPEAATLLRMAFPLDNGEVPNSLERVLFHRVNGAGDRYGPIYKGWIENIRGVRQIVLDIVVEAAKTGEDYGRIGVFGEKWHYWKLEDSTFSSEEVK